MAIAIPKTITWYEAGPSSTCNGRPCGTHGSSGAKLKGLWAAWPCGDAPKLYKKTITVKAGGKSVSVPVLDCNAGSSLDLSKAAFSKLADPSVGVLKVQSITGPGISSAPTTSKKTRGSKKTPDAGGKSDPKLSSCLAPLTEEAKKIAKDRLGLLILPEETNTDNPETVAKFESSVGDVVAFALSRCPTSNTVDLHAIKGWACQLTAAVWASEHGYLGDYRNSSPTCLDTGTDVTGKPGPQEDPFDPYNVLKAFFDLVTGGATWTRVLLVLGGVGLLALIAWKLVKG